jgi:hypothetical protein
MTRYARWIIKHDATRRQARREGMLVVTLKTEITRELDKQILEAIMRELQ